MNLFNAGMRGSKGTPWLGGTRAISLWRWPGTLQPAPIEKLAAHIDIFPTLAALAGVALNDDLRRQVHGRSLVPLLQNPGAAWADRMQVTHVGRWERGQAAAAKYRNCSIRDSRWHMVCTSKSGQRDWQLYDLKSDPGEETDVAAKHPEVITRLAAAYDKWWESVQPYLVNEAAVGPSVNPFKALYWKQFGGAPAEPKNL